MKVMIEKKFQLNYLIKMKFVVNSFSQNKRKFYSYGLIIFCKKTQNYAKVKERHSVPFILLLRGSFTEVLLPYYVSSITLEEKNMILNSNFETLFRTNIGKNPSEIQKRVFKKYQKKIKELLHKYDHSNNTTEYSWPKGKPKKGETFLQCSVREAEEELNCKLPAKYNISKETVAIIENGYDDLEICKKYWIVVVDEEFSLGTNYDIEISERKWLPHDPSDYNEKKIHELILSSIF